ncbi:MAG: hypothetical protein QOE70_5979 [Chthoniobacter sp.]|jgi:SAM-dependent methyltransferase|nr:hypothetical protein [Chthoniobacter sp.]
MLDPSAHANAARFRGSLELYDRYRPAPPPFLIDLLQRFGRIVRPALVVDLGCGTGLSTRFWAEHAARVVGIDPNPEMLAFARGATVSPQVTFQDGLSHATGLGAGSVDLVVCCQSIHWMDPEPTIAEVARILRPGGVFAAASYDFPPILDWELDLAVQTCLSRARRMSEALGSREKRWASGHGARLESSGRFRRVREIAMHGEDKGDATRLLGCLRTLGDVTKAIQHGANEAGLGLEELELIARRIMGNEPAHWSWSYSVILAVKR